MKFWCGHNQSMWAMIRNSKSSYIGVINSMTLKGALDFCLTLGSTGLEHFVFIVLHF